LDAKFKNRKMPGHFIRTQKDADQWSYQARFWRKGAKQREDRYLPGEDLASATPSIVAFDGQIVRRLSPENKEGQIRGAISTAKSDTWFGSPREDPYTFLYAFYETLYSQLVAESKGFRAELPVPKSGQFHVVFECNSGTLVGYFSLGLVLDERHRIIGRDIYGMDPKKGRSLREKHVYSEYTAYPDSSRENIWYPNQIVKTVYAEDIVCLTYSYKINHIEFNVDLADSLFEPEIPNTATVYDGVRGMGWLPPGQRPAALFPDVARHQRWWWTAAIVLAGLTLVAAGVWFKRRRPAPNASGASRPAKETS
jgi:hypothetical protein